MDPGQPPPSSLPQIGFAGRSNVGKSSLINRILGRTRRRIARVSASPGKTQALNFYEVNQAFYLVDFPGSGYAKAPRSVRAGWQRLVWEHMARSAELQGVVYLVDSRHPPTNGDLEFVARLAETARPTLIALTKVDKLKARVREAGIVGPAARRLEVSEDQVVPCSARTGEGTDTLLAALAALVEVN